MGFGNNGYTIKDPIQSAIMEKMDSIKAKKDECKNKIDALDDNITEAENTIAQAEMTKKLLQTEISKYCAKQTSMETGLAHIMKAGE